MLKLTTSRLVYEHIHPFLDNLTYESMYITLLNTGNQLIKSVCISEWGIGGTQVDPKKVFKIALDHYAAGILLSPNHPSENLQPRTSYIVLTKKIVEVGKLLDINVTDHLIIGEDGYFSFSDEGMMG